MVFPLFTNSSSCTRVWPLPIFLRHPFGDGVGDGFWIPPLNDPFLLRLSLPPSGTVEGFDPPFSSVATSVPFSRVSGNFLFSSSPAAPCDILSLPFWTERRFRLLFLDLEGKFLFDNLISSLTELLSLPFQLDAETVCCWTCRSLCDRFSFAATSLFPPLQVTLPPCRKKAPPLFFFPEFSGLAYFFDATAICLLANEPALSDYSIFCPATSPALQRVWFSLSPPPALCDDTTLPPWLKCPPLWGFFFLTDVFLGAVSHSPDSVLSVFSPGSPVSGSKSLLSDKRNFLHLREIIPPFPPSQRSTIPRTA